MLFSRRFIIVRAAALVFFAGWLTSLSSGQIESAPPSPREVIAVIPHDAPPTYFRDEKTGRPAGFAVDIMNVVAKRAGIQVTYVFGHNWADIMETVRQGKADVIPIMGVSEGRKKGFAFTSFLDSFPISVFVRSGNDTINGLQRGMKVGVIRGCMAYDYLKGRTDMSIVQYAGFEEGLFDLLAGRIDAFSCPAPIFEKLARDAGVEDKIKVAGSPVAEMKRAIAVRKDDRVLLDQLNRAIEGFAGSPEYKGIYVKWYGRPAPYWNPRRIFIAMLVLVFTSVCAMAFWRYRSLLKLNRELREHVDERRRTEETLRSYAVEMDDLYNNAPCGYHSLDRNGVFIRINNTELSWLGCTREELTGKKRFSDFLAPRSRKLYEETFRLLGEKGRMRDMELEVICSDGLALPVLLSSSAVQDETGRFLMCRSTVYNISEYKRLEGQLMKAQKMEVVGQLAGGIAHDFNNILSGIMGFGHIIKRKLKDDDPLRPHAQQIIELSKKAANLTQGLLAFSRKQVLEPQPVDVNGIVEGFQKILVRVIGEDIEVKIHPSSGDLIVMADAGQLEQVLMNLATNARDAMPGGGTFSIKTEVAGTDDRSLQRFIRAEKDGVAGGYALISVSDTGTGINENVREHIFEPFFTTKEVGKGTGLGLAMVYGIIKQHNGYINVESGLETGTTFRIYLPLIPMAGESEESQELSQPSGGTETILLAEDDPSVRLVTKSVLENFGYKVIEAADGEDALRVFAENRNKVQLVILDVIMPKKNGREIYDEIARMNHGTRVLFISGYAADMISSKGILGEGVNFASKPVVPEELLRKVRAVLDS